MDPYRESMASQEDEESTWTDHLSDKSALDPRWDPIRKNLGYTRIYANKMDLVSMIPRNDLASTKYCLANPGKEYFVYIPEGGKVTVDLSGVSGELSVEWFSPLGGEVKSAGNTVGGDSREFAVPFNGDAALYIAAK